MSGVNISVERAQKICLVGGPDQCSFMHYEKGRFSCLKNSPREGDINKRKLEGKIFAKGDYCSGPPEFEPANESVRLATLILVEP